MNAVGKAGDPPLETRLTASEDCTMRETQEPKYGITSAEKYPQPGAMLVNRFTGEVIPHDEPVFVLRAKDRHALRTLLYYASEVEQHEHRSAVTDRAADFARFAAEHPERMKEPDTARGS